MDEASNANIAYKIVLLVVLVASFAVYARHNMRIATVVRYAAIWIAIFLAIGAAYTLRDDAAALGDRMLADLLPTHGLAEGPRKISFRAGNDGHFRVAATVNGVGVEFLVDTGATVVSLSRRDAARIGIDVERLQFTRTVQTANGPARDAPVRLQEIRVGPITVSDVRAAVSNERSDESLLGMSFLERLQGYTVSGGTLTLTGTP
jgi:aspartyl protease family protein